LTFELDVGQIANLETEVGPITASRVRIWARSAGGTMWDEHQGIDLWLVPETDPDGLHRYTAPNVELFTYTFSQ
jgi:hypothetical protein